MRLTSNYYAGEVGTAADGFVSAHVACRDLCVAEGYGFFGLGCPAEESTMCQCYLESHLRDNGIRSPSTQSCEDKGGRCYAAPSLEYQGNTYYLGGAWSSAIYSTAYEIDAPAPCDDWPSPASVAAS